MLMDFSSEQPKVENDLQRVFKKLYFLSDWISLNLCGSI